MHSETKQTEMLRFGPDKGLLQGFPFTFHFHALEKEMATHFCLLAWRIPRTGEIGGLPTMGRIELDMTEAT